MTAPAPIAEILMNCLRVAILYSVFATISGHCRGSSEDLSAGHNFTISEGTVLRLTAQF
jgi:hypothetical protein